VIIKVKEKKMALAQPVNVDIDILEVHCDTNEFYQEQVSSEVGPRLVLPPADHHTRNQELRSATLFTNRGCVLQFVYDDGSKFPVVIGCVRTNVVDRAKIHEYLTTKTKEIAEIGLAYLKYTLTRRNSPIIKNDITVDDVAIDFSVSRSLLCGQRDVVNQAASIWMLDQETISFAQDLGPGSYFQERYAIVINCHLDLRPVEERGNRVGGLPSSRAWTASFEIPPVPEYDEKAAQLAAERKKKFATRLGPPVGSPTGSYRSNQSDRVSPGLPGNTDPGPKGPDVGAATVGNQDKGKSKNWKKKQKQRLSGTSPSGEPGAVASDSPGTGSDLTGEAKGILPGPTEVSSNRASPKSVQPPADATGAAAKSNMPGKEDLPRPGSQATKAAEANNLKKSFDKPIVFGGDAREKIKGASNQGFNFSRPWEGREEPYKFGHPKPYYRSSPPYQKARGHPAGAPSGRGDFQQFSYPPPRANYGYGRKYSYPRNYSHPDLGYY